MLSIQSGSSFEQRRVKKPSTTPPPPLPPIADVNARLFEGMAIIIEATIRGNGWRGNTLDPRKYKKSIKKFLKKIRKHSDLHPFCFVAAMGYLYRVRAATPFSLTPSTWKLLVATAIMVAQKVSDDESYFNSDFVKLLGPTYNLTQLNQTEAKFLISLNWNCSFTFSEYRRYYKWITSAARNKATT